MIRSTRAGTAWGLLLLALVLAVSPAASALQNDPYEPNDSIEEAYAIDELPFETTDAGIATPDDQDVYAFELSEAALVQIDVDAESRGSSLDGTLALLDEQGQEILSNDDAHGLDPAIDADLEAGRYFIVVADYPGGVLFPPSSGPYVLSIQARASLEGDVEDPYEPNDALEQAHRISELPFAATRPSIAADDRDVFAFELSARALVQADVDAQALGSALDSTLTLLSQQGEELAFNDDADGRDPALRQILQAGRYYVAVESYGGSTGRYQLRIRANQVISCQARTIRDQERELWDLGDLAPGSRYSIVLEGPADADFDLHILEVVSRHPMVTAVVHRSVSLSADELISFSVGGERARPFIAAVSSFASGGDYSLCLFAD